ncbi:hypothetical protein GY21_13805 [Cryobacterium roopkundense]|uniref:DUF5134 domain-containing protein n=1 Tax=Cryobacterium roopkundense TaxID=1001240 RepID=A0A099J3Q4_9MICO|nr:DUF5134 domain-containing protein [Cryobacterium roopkundense]KGJ72675.1 hypothetical protein GY21_13805 [Cryobacterium roopkundense]MBB5639613.1 hypothetical protein [Cryobacterium roopkundense]
MVDNVVLQVALSALLAAALVYSLVRAAASGSRSARVDFGLQSLMGGAMLAMLSGAVWSFLPTVVFSSAATWWFAIRASAHPTSVAGCAGRMSRSACVFHGTMMAATAFMAGSMLAAGTLESGARSVQAAGAHQVAAAAAAHEHGVAGGFGAWAPAPGTGTLDPTLIAAVILAAAVGWRAVLLVASLRATHDGAGGAVRGRRFRRADLGAEIVGAAAMAMMFAAHVSG